MISYADLLETFWNTHNHCRSAFSRQYRSAIFYQNESQKKLALASKELRSAKAKVQTEIEPLARFYLAEDYHQKYQLRQNAELMRDFDRLYPDLENFINSTAAARVNGYLGGHGNAENLKADIPKLGLSDESNALLTGIVRR